MRRLNEKLLTVALIAVGLVAGGAVLWKHINTNRCRDRVMVLGFDLYGALHGPSFVQDGMKSGEPPLIFVERTYYRHRLDYLICPSDRLVVYSADHQHLADNSVSYATWDWKELPETIRSPGALLVWEKRPNHSGKRWVFDSMLNPWLVDGETFRMMFEYSERLVKREPQAADDREAQDRLDELRNRLKKAQK